MKIAKKYVNIILSRYFVIAHAYYYSLELCFSIENSLTENAHSKCRTGSFKSSVRYLVDASDTCHIPTYMYSFYGSSALQTTTKRS